MPPILSEDEGSSSEVEQIEKPTKAFRRKLSVTPEVSKPIIVDDDDDENENENEDIPGKNRKAQAAEEEEEEDDDEDEEDGEEGDDIYVVEAIMNHIIGEDGKPSFLVKWEGYEKKTDMTWEPEENFLGSAELILNKYYESVGGRDFILNGESKPKKKRGRQPNVGTPDVKSNGKKAKKEHPASSTPPASLKTEWKPPTGSWEEDIASIDAIEDVGGKLSVYVQWNDGRQSQHEVRAMYSHCPQKMLKFYESHLVFKPGGGTSTQALRKPDDEEN